MKERYDNKGRKLQKGETQRKDGRYMYKYMDSTGKTKYIYSWRLGHARIDVTLNVYTRIDFEYVTEEMQKISRQYVIIKLNSKYAIWHTKV